MSYETFMKAKLYLLTEGEIGAPEADELLRNHLQGVFRWNTSDYSGHNLIFCGIPDSNMDSLTDNESSMLILWQAGDRDAKVRPDAWKNAKKTSLLTALEQIIRKGYSLVQGRPYFCISGCSESRWTML